MSATSAKLTDALWKTQSMMHSSDSKTMPALLLLTAGSLVLYRHCTATEFDHFDGKDEIKTFLALIVLQMLPLIFLEVKILSCPDPVGQLSKFGTKVMLMHACFLALRAFFIRDGVNGAFNYAALAGACIVLRVGFNFQLSLMDFWQHRDVWCLALMALAAAFVTEAVDIFFNSYFTDVAQALCSVTSDYIEILAFVPAVWSVAQAHKNLEADFTVSKVDPRKQSVFFFGFLICLYFNEDCLNGAFVHIFDMPLAAAGNSAHFMLLLDFAGFVLAHIYNPDNLKGKLLRWLPDACVPGAQYV